MPDLDQDHEQDAESTEQDIEKDVEHTKQPEKKPTVGSIIIKRIMSSWTIVIAIGGIFAAGSYLVTLGQQTVHTWVHEEVTKTTDSVSFNKSLVTTVMSTPQFITGVEDTIKLRLIDRVASEASSRNRIVDAVISDPDMRDVLSRALIRNPQFRQDLIDTILSDNRIIHGVQGDTGDKGPTGDRGPSGICPICSCSMTATKGQ